VSGLVQLHGYQQYAADFALDRYRAGLFLEMGLGKTLAMLYAVDKLMYDSFDIETVLVIAPKKVALDTWPGEIRKWGFTNITYSVAVGSEKERKQALAKKADVYIINRENVSWLKGHLGRKWLDRFDCIVIDELSSFKSTNSQRFRALKNDIQKVKYVYGLTGTPAPNGLIDLWAQIYLLDGGERLGKTKQAFQDKYFVALKKYKRDKQGRLKEYMDYEAKQEAERAIYAAIADICISMKEEDHLKLPDLVEVDRKIILEPAARKLYNRLERVRVIPYADTFITGDQAATLQGKLLQMASGAVYDDDKSVQQIHTAKIEALKDIVEEANGRPVAVFYHYRHSLHNIQAILPDARILRTGPKESVEDISDWNNNKIPVFLLHPQSAGHGLNLQYGDCRCVVWYDQIWSLEATKQAIKRVHRQGQKHSVTLVRLITADTIDEQVVQAIKNKDIGQEALMAAVKARIDKYA
jgi:SNF2 family DNA or RNA helicase